MDNSKSSSDESDKQDPLNEDTGTGRSYECVFCKRGFTTAQALGGHMNIHRRDRARTKQPVCPPNAIQSAFFHASSIHSTFNSTIMETHRNYQPYFPTSSNEHLQLGCHREDLHFHKTKALCLLDENWHPTLSLQLSPTHLKDNYGEKKPAEDTDEIDLELRLGHDP